MASFDGMNQGQPRAGKYGGPWSVHESAKLKYLVGKSAGTACQLHWVEIAREHGTRDAKQCRERWDNHLKPGLRRDKISDAEGRDIMNWVGLHGKHWAPLGRRMQRPENMVKNYWYQEHKKLERGGRQKGQRVSPPRLSRSHSSSSQHAYNDPSAYSGPSVSPAYPPPYPYHHGVSPTYTSPQYYHQAPQHHSWNYGYSSSIPSQQYQPRRISDASAPEQTPSLASDHGSPVESPRTAPCIPYLQGQHTLPSFIPPSQQLKLHRRSTSSFSDVSTGAIPVSPTSERYPSCAMNNDSLAYRPRLDIPTMSGTSSSARKGSDPRMSISNLIS